MVRRGDWICQRKLSLDPTGTQGLILALDWCCCSPLNWPRPKKLRSGHVHSLTGWHICNAQGCFQHRFAKGPHGSTTEGQAHTYFLQILFAALIKCIPVCWYTQPVKILNLHKFLNSSLFIYYYLSIPSVYCSSLYPAVIISYINYFIATSINHTFTFCHYEVQVGYVSCMWCWIEGRCGRVREGGGAVEGVEGGQCKF